MTRVKQDYDEQLSGAYIVTFASGVSEMCLVTLTFLSIYF